MLYLLNGDRVDAGERLVEHDELRVDGEAASDLGASALAAGELVAHVLAHFSEVEVGNERFELLKLLMVRELCHLEHRHDVVLHAQLAEHACPLRQIADAGACSFVNGIVGYLLVVEIDVAVVGHNETGGHVERRCLAGAVRSEQTYDFALLHVDGHIVDNGTLAVSFHQSFGAQHHAVGLVLCSSFCRLTILYVDFTHDLVIIYSTKVVQIDRKPTNKT